MHFFSFLGWFNDPLSNVTKEQVIEGLTSRILDRLGQLCPNTWGFE